MNGYVVGEKLFSLTILYKYSQLSHLAKAVKFVISFMVYKVLPHKFTHHILTLALFYKFKTMDQTC